MRMKILTIGAVFLVAAISAGWSQVGTKKIEADRRVEKLLQEADLKYSIDSEGDFKLFTKVKTDRIQAIWIISETQNVGSLEIRQIWSIGYASDTPFPPAVLNRLLEENAKVKLGAWQVRRMGTKYVAVFSAQVGAEIDRFSLLLCLSTVASTADDMEKELSGADTY